MKRILVLSIALLFVVGIHNLTAADKTGVGSTTGGKIVKSGTTGAQFLKIDVGSRGSAIGAYGSVTNDLSSMYWNAAGLADVKGLAAEFSYNQWFANVNHNYMALGIPLGDDYTIGIAYTSLGVDDIPITTTNKPEGTGAKYDVKDMAIGLSFAGYLTKQFSFGITAKYISNSFANIASQGVAFDIGTMYDAEIYGVKVGFAISNLGLEQKYSGQDLRSMVKNDEGLNKNPSDIEYMTNYFNLPLIFRASISSEVVSNETHNLIISGDFLTTSDASEEYIIGGEYAWKDMIAFRAGYRINHDQINLTGGVGLKYFSSAFAGRIDYAIVPTVDLGWVHRLSICLDIQ